MKPVLFLLFVAGPCAAQMLPAGARSLALNGQQTLVSEDAGTVFLNPAQLVVLPAYSIWLNHYTPFGLKTLHFNAAAVQVSRRAVAFGFGVMEFGGRIYRDRYYSAAAAARLQELVSLGMRIRWRQVQIDGYGSAGNAAFDLGARFDATVEIALGLLVKNVVAGEIGQSGERPEREVRAAVQLRVTPLQTAFLEIGQAAHEQTEYAIGFEYRLFGWMPLRVGTGINSPDAFTAGFGFTFKRFRLNYALQTHPVLAQSHIFSLSLVGE